MDQIPAEAKSGEVFQTPVKSKTSPEQGDEAPRTSGKRDCAVCLSPVDAAKLEHRGGVAITRCMHKFHKNCLEEARKYNQRCPMCRTKLLSPKQPRTHRAAGEVDPVISVFGVSNRANPQQHSAMVALQTAATNQYGMRSAIQQAASRGRNAVKAAMERRQQREQQALATAQLITDSFATVQPTDWEF